MEPTESENGTETEMATRSSISNNVITGEAMLSPEHFKQSLALEESYSLQPTTTGAKLSTSSSNLSSNAVVNTTNHNLPNKDERMLNVDATIGVEEKESSTTAIVDRRLQETGWDVPTKDTALVLNSECNTSFTDTNEDEPSENPNGLPALEMVTCAVVAESAHNTTGVEVAMSTWSSLPPATVQPVVTNVTNPTDKPATLNHHQQQQQQRCVTTEQEDKNPLSLVSLPIDALHNIAGFLTSFDWANFGLSDKRTNQVCRNVFCRVRMHGFRCATEVITAWVCCLYCCHLVGSISILVLKSIRHFSRPFQPPPSLET
jgi:hypothetical protein